MDTKAFEAQFAPIVVSVGPEKSSVVLRQMGGLQRIAFACEASLIADALDNGEDAAEDFGFIARAADEVAASASAFRKSRQLLIEMVLGLEWGWVRVDNRGDLNPALWVCERRSLLHLLEMGDPPASVPPLAAVLGRWFNGPLLEMVGEGEL